MPRHRQSTAGPSARPSGATTVFEYQPLEAPLHPKKQQDLKRLAKESSFTKLTAHQEKAALMLTSSASDINELIFDMENKASQKKARRVEKGRERDEEEEERDQNLIETRQLVEEKTARLEEEIRKVIDSQQERITAKNCLDKISSELQNQTANTQYTQASTQRRPRGRQVLNENGEEELSDIEPTDPAGGSDPSQPPVSAPSSLFMESLEKEKNAYQSLSLSCRYAQHNVYVGFKRSVHDALQYDDDPRQLAHHSKWFAEPGASPQPGMTADDSDDDIAVARQKVSTKCPLTLLEYVNPVTSDKCRHSFEKNAIMEMIGRSSISAVKCPVFGCDQMLKAVNLHTDTALLRKIRRIQQSRNADRSDDDDDDEPGNSAARRRQSVGSESAEDIEAPRQTHTQAKIKSSAHTSQGNIRSSGAIVDLSDEEEDEV
ncbi:hypothetical protein K402DRAFT_405620 [Aulographum hederae CBS 113979]|uniref:SP-RING-type domain-containing protein n=1 Tax=Aulographum hederae CBS 113979 TaxID=1176131 RepID=A0A6G1GVR5_9PEZI|nr:hypothetical protein K402DRAFT_405620 [Aulographum hederae CBS 113979]